MELGFASVGAITVIVYVLAEIIKQTTIDSKWLPGICGVVGMILGIVSMRVMPDFPATDLITALAVGAVSGLAATGINQLYKQVTE